MSLYYVAFLASPKTAAVSIFDSSDKLLGVIHEKKRCLVCLEAGRTAGPDVIELNPPPCKATADFDRGPVMKLESVYPGGTVVARIDPRTRSI